MTVIPAGLSNPTIGTVPRGAYSVRRTTHIDMSFGSPGEDYLRLSGAARDAYTNGDGHLIVVADAQVDARLDKSRSLSALTTLPVEPAAGQLVGRPVGRGFRAALDSTDWQVISDRDPLHLLLDDLPVAALISGYATLYNSGQSGARETEGGQESATRSGGRSMQEDICSGWRHDGTMMVALRSAGSVPTTVGPPAPRLDADDPDGWHAMEELPMSSMRRRRLIDVVAGDPIGVNAMFRDTHRGPDGIETVLHEYTLEALVEPSARIVTYCRAQPRTLPWPECPAAADSASRLEGQPVDGLQTFVQKHLRGTTTCTHLNDLLRSLAVVRALLAELDERRG
jgi:hypothetical protein